MKSSIIIAKKPTALDVKLHQLKSSMMGLDNCGIIPAYQPFYVRKKW